MRNTLIVVVSMVGFILVWILVSHSYDSGIIYVFSFLSTAFCGYLFSDYLFNEQKKSLTEKLNQSQKDFEALHSESDILKKQAALSTPQSEVIDLQQRFTESENDRKVLKNTLASQALTISDLNKQIEALKTSPISASALTVEPLLNSPDVAAVHTDISTPAMAIASIAGVAAVIESPKTSEVALKNDMPEPTVGHDLLSLNPIVESLPKTLLETEHTVEANQAALNEPLKESAEFGTPILVSQEEKNLFPLDPNDTLNTHETTTLEAPVASNVLNETPHIAEELKLPNLTTNGTVFLSAEKDVVEEVPFRKNLKSEEDFFIEDTDLNEEMTFELDPHTHTHAPHEVPALVDAELPPSETQAPHSSDVKPADDLKIVEGIGPRLELILYNAGIRTFKDLSETRVDKLRDIITAAGKNPNFNDPSTWPEQARLLANGEFEKFRAYTNWLIGGKIPGVD